jgi:hypothetical protein
MDRVQRGMGNWPVDIRSLNAHCRLCAIRPTDVADCRLFGPAFSAIRFLEFRRVNGLLPLKPPLAGFKRGR